MNYLLHFHYKADADRQAIAQLIPAEQARVAELHRAGLLQAVYVAKDMQQGWLVLDADDEAAATAILRSLPLHAFWEVDAAVPVNMPALR